MSYRNIIVSTVALCTFVAFLNSPARADVSIYAYESGGQVIFSYTGRLNTPSLGSNYTWYLRGSVYPAGREIGFGSSSNSPNDSVRYYWNTVLSSPSSLGTGLPAVPTTFTGAYFSITPYEVVVPVGYNGSTILSGSMNFAGETFQTLGINTTGGPYVWNLDNGERVTLSFGSPPTQNRLVALKRKLKALNYQLSLAKKNKKQAKIRSLRIAISKVKRQIRLL